MAPDFFEKFFAAANRFERALPGEHFDPAHSRRDARFRFELEEADIARAIYVRAAAKFDREIAHAHDAHDIAVLVAEERKRTSFNRVVVSHLLGRDFGVLANARVDIFFDRREVALAHWPLMAEIEAQPIWRDQRARLMDVRTQDFAQR